MVDARPRPAHAPNGLARHLPPARTRKRARTASPASRRKARQRQRERDGLLPLAVDVPAEIVLHLVDAGLLAPVDGEDKAKVASAVSRLLAALISDSDTV